MTCKFYHPEIAFPSDHYSKRGNNNASMSKGKQFEVPMSETLCKFGDKCNRPGCKFKHEGKGQEKSIGKDKKPREFDPETGKEVCKFGDRCRFFQQGTCKNYHPSGNSDSMNEPKRPAAGLAFVPQNFKPQS